MTSLVDGTQYQLLDPETTLVGEGWESIRVKGYAAREDELHDKLVLVKKSN